MQFSFMQKIVKKNHQVVAYVNHMHILEDLVDGDILDSAEMLWVWFSLSKIFDQLTPTENQEKRTRVASDKVEVPLDHPYGMCDVPYIV
jgi:uncharacterized Rmd1/YagE family protein